ncbi:MULTISPECIES: helix-turn-helix domain-containing protein [Paenibacillus]|uniref:Helix-turn-helix domain-containing protein n=1 Tax=Paenibacillus artemisiicola TaxID=1172618 RepID=A0ABS3W780_9BACL|nr:helix-turn-helix domain-containing protein [Paenibacillus artemisiicola]MBO7744165.1 helix-turn-helix domain-containing protein [Paenibacillus artemisiicola]
MQFEKETSDFFKSIKQKLIEEIRGELLPIIYTEVYHHCLTVPDAARYTGLSEDTIYTLCKQKQIPHYRGGAANSKKPKIFFRAGSLDKWMHEQEKENCIGWGEGAVQNEPMLK